MTREQMIDEAKRRHKMLRRLHHGLARAHRSCLRWGFPMLLLCEPIYRLCWVTFNAAEAEFRRIAGDQTRSRTWPTPT